MRSVTFSPGKTRVVCNPLDALASSSLDLIIRIWNVAKMEVEHRLKGHMDWVTSVAVLPDGTHAVSGSTTELGSRMLFLGR